MRKLPAALLVSAVGASLLVVAPSASAGPRVNMDIADAAEFPGRDGMSCTDNRSSPKGKSAEVCYEPGADRFWVYDAKRDGNSAVALWHLPTEIPTVSASGYCRNRSKFRSWAFCQYEFPGQGRIEFGAGIYDGNSGKTEKAFPDRFRGWTSSIL
jgi:hypothetical protein